MVAVRNPVHPVGHHDKGEAWQVSVRFLIAAIALLASVEALHAEEGLWTPEQIPGLAEELEAIGLGAQGETLSKVNQGPLAAVVQFAGCTASFVSPQGLLLTNYHCVFPALQYNSTPQRDLIRKGFLARSREEELWNGPLSRVYMTTGSSDVTDRLMGRMPANMSNRERHSVIDRREKQLVKDCERAASARCRVVSAYGGLQYILLTQKEILDVRLVYAPSRAVGEFGGDLDNWMWPRHTADFALLRLYVAKDGSAAAYSKDNVPLKSANHLKLSTRGVDAGEPLIVLGYPGKTYRYKTAGETRHVTDSWYPRSIRFTRQYINTLKTVGMRDEEARLRNAATLLKHENLLKNMEGTLDGMRTGRLLQRKELEETQLREILKRGEQGGPNPVDEIGILNERAMQYEQRDHILYWLARASPLLSQAVTLYRLSQERPRPDMDRQWGYQERDIPRIRESIERSQRSLDIPTERAALRFVLAEAMSLPADQRIPAIDSVLGDGQEVDQRIAVFLDRLFGDTRMVDLAERLRMFQMSTGSLRKRDDSLIEFAAVLTPMFIEAEAREEETWAAMLAARPRYMEILKQWRGGKIYPDANSSLRVSFGRVEGYSPREAVLYAPQTTLPGLLQKNRGVEPFDVPREFERAAVARKKVAYIDKDLDAIPVNFLSTADTTGGSSGSPTLNKHGEIVGVVFDGNYEAIASDFVFNRDVTRTIHLDTLYMLWVLDAVEGADELLRELSIEPQFD